MLGSFVVTPAFIVAKNTYVQKFSDESSDDSSKT